MAGKKKIKLFGIIPVEPLFTDEEMDELDKRFPGFSNLAYKEKKDGE